MIKVTLVKVQSSMIAAVGYDSHKGILVVKFNSGAIYQYSNVPAHVYKELMAADSIGHYFRMNIREAFRNKQIKVRANLKTRPVAVAG